MQQFQLLNQQQQPYIQSGYGALSRLNTLMGLSPNPNARSSGGMPGSMMPGNGGPRDSQGVPYSLYPGGQPPGNAYMPTPGGGVQPIMQGGAQPNVRLNDPYISGGGSGIPLQRILALRAMHGDTQAGRILGMQQ